MPRVFARPFPFDSELNNIKDLLTFGPDDIVVSDEIKLIFGVRAASPDLCEAQTA